MEHPCLLRSPTHNRGCDIIWTIRPDFNSAAEFELCDQCHRSGVILLKSMAKWSPLDWFGCDVCGHIFTRARPTDPNDVGYHRGPKGSKTDGQRCLEIPLLTIVTEPWRYPRAPRRSV